MHRAARQRPLPAQTSTSDLVRSLSNALSRAAAANRQRKIVGPLIAPLAYDPAAGPIDPQNFHDPRNLDVAGVRLGMTVDEARAALRGGGYTDESINSVELSYATLVTNQWVQEYGYKSPVEERVTNGIVWHKRAGGGTGLGLTIARSFIEAHGGAIALLELQDGAEFESNCHSRPEDVCVTRRLACIKHVGVSSPSSLSGAVPKKSPARPLGSLAAHRAA